MKVHATTSATRILQRASLAILSLALTLGAAHAADPEERTEGKAASTPSREPDKSDDMPDPRVRQSAPPASPSK